MNKSLIILTIILLSSFTWAKEIEQQSTSFDPLKVMADEYLKQAFTLYNQLEFEKAITLYKKALDLTPDSAQVWYWLGRSYYRTGQMPQFFSAWERLLKLSKEDTSEIKRKMLVYSENHIKSNTYRYFDTIKGKDDFAIYNPAGIVIDSEDNFYISSFGNNAILKFSPIGKPLLRFGQKGKDKGKLNKPAGIVLDKEGNIYVTDFGNHRIQKFTSEGKFLMAFGKEGKKSGEFINPEGIALDSKEYIYVVDNGNHRIQIFSPEGKFVGKIDEMLLSPIGVVVDKRERIWVIERGGNYLKQFATSGRLQNNFPFPQKGLIPKGITYALDGKLYLSFSQGSIFKFDIENQKWEKLNLPSKFPAPLTLAVNKYGLLYVIGFENNSILVFIPEEAKDTQFDVLVNRIDTSGYPTIIMPVMVTSKHKTPILGLTSNNFKVEENGRQMQPIALGTPVYENEYLVTTFIIDTSKKMVKYRKDVQELLNKFVSEIKGGIQGVSIIGFSEKAEYIQSITRNKTALRDKIERLRPGKNSRDKDAIFSGIKLGVSEMNYLLCKKAICLITYGDEVEEETLFRECSDYAKNNHIPIFIVDFRGQDETKSLKKLASNYFLAYQSQKAQKLYETISTQIKNQNIYLISYKTPQEQWALKWVDVTVSAGHRRLCAYDKINYVVPPGKGIDKEIIAKIENRIQKKRKELYEEKMKELEEEKKGKAGHKAEGGHGEKGKPEGFPPPKTWEEDIQPDIGSPVREKFVPDEKTKPGGGGHGGGH
ncbi:MAG: tetratricopeptide repeat protein [bacterium]